MNDSEELTVWIERLREGDEEAADVIWRKCFDRMTRLAKSKLGPAAQQGGDEEDVALSAINSFVVRARDGKFPQLADSDDLWKLLITITVRKACQHIRRQKAMRRGGVNNRANLPGSHPDSSTGPRMDQIADPTAITPDRLFEQLDQKNLFYETINGLEDDLRRVAIGRLEGRTNQQLARELDCSTRTIERKLRLIRKIWQKGADS